MAATKKPISIVIGIPNMGEIRIETFNSIFDALSYTPNWRFKLKTIKGSMLPDLRETIVDFALSQERITHLLFIDSDMIFPEDAIKKLVEDDKPIISADYNMKNVFPSLSVTRYDVHKFKPEQIVSHPEVPGTYTMQKLTKITKVLAVGTGFMLIQIEALRKIPKPKFMFGFEKGQILGEDVFFCKKARENGIEVWVDPTIKMGHVGDFVY